MNTLNVLMASLLLLMPGFLGLSIFRYIQGVRLAEAQGTLLWSLLLSGLTLLIVLLLGPSLGWAPATTFLNLTVDDAARLPTLAEVLRLSGAACLLTAGLGVVIGLLVRLEAVRALIAGATGQVFNPDPWANLLGGAIDEPAVVVRMEDGRQYLGNAVQVSETVSGRTIALKNALLFAPEDQEMSTPIVPGSPGLMVITSKIESVTVLDQDLDAQVEANTARPEALEAGAVLRPLDEESGWS